MKSNFFLFLFLFLISASFNIYASTDWTTWRYDTLHDSAPEETFSRFDLGINTLKDFYGIGSANQLRVFNQDFISAEGDNATRPYTIFIDNNNILRVYNKYFVLLNYSLNHNTSSVPFTNDFEINEMVINDFFIDDKFDIIFLERNNNENNITWYQFDGINLDLKYTENLVNSSNGITCNDNPPFCVFTTFEVSNHSTFFKLDLNSYTIDTLDMSNNGQDVNYLVSASYYERCNGIPILKDLDYDGNIEAVFCSYLNVTGATSYSPDLIMIDATNMVFKNTFNSDGILTDVASTFGGNLIAVNVDGADEPIFELAMTSDDELHLYDIYGNTRFNVDLNSYCETGDYMVSLSRTDVNYDLKSDILAYCSVGSGITKYSGLIAVNFEGIVKSYHKFYYTNSNGFSKGNIVMTDLDNTGIGITVTGIVTDGGLALLTYWNNNSANNPNQIFNTSGFVMTTSAIEAETVYNPIVADFNGDNLYEIGYSRSLDSWGVSANTTIYSAIYTNVPTTFESYEINTGTPVCPEEIVTFTCNGYDNDNDMINCGIDIYGNDSIEWGSFTKYSNYSITTHKFLISEIGILFDNMKIYMSDEGHPYNTEIFEIIPITYQVEDSIICHHTGEGGFEESINETGGFIDGEPVTDFSDFINSVLILTGMNSAIGKGMIVLFILIMSIVGLSKIGNVPSEAYIIILITELGLFAWLEFLPVWLIILMIIVASAFIVWLFRQPTGVAK